MNIFKTHAPKYYAKGISVIPLRENSKIPLPNAWSDYQDYPVPQDVQNYFLALPANHNIGLVLGKQSNISVLDFDYDDPELIAKIMAILPEQSTTWKRVGKKGFVLAFRFNPMIRSFRLISQELGTIIEYLSSGTQVVLPPSIHPDTMEPYTANCDLVDVYDKLPILPNDLEDTLRSIIELHGIELRSRGSGTMIDIIPAGFRDSSLTNVAGLLAFEVTKGRLPLKRAIEMLYAKESEFMEKVAGDAMDMDKHVRNLIKFVLTDLKRCNRVLPQGWDEGMTEDDIVKLGLKDMECEWTYEKIIDHYSLEVDNSRDSVEVINFAISKLAQITDVDAIYESEVLDKIISKSDRNLKINDLRKQLSKMRTQIEQQREVDNVVLDLNTHTEVAMAALEALSHINPIAVENGVIYQWMGSHWSVKSLNDVKSFIAKQYSTVAIMKRHSDIEGVFKQLLILAPQGLKKDARQIVNVANGVLTEHGQFIPHNPDFGATYVLPYRYVVYPKPFDMYANMPLFETFLRDCWGHRDDYAELLMALQEALCASFMGYATRFQRAFLLYGLARTGKSVLLEIIASLFPDEAKTSVAFSKMHDNQMLVSLDKKLLNVVGELSEKARIEGDIFKSVVDGSPMSVRHHYQATFNMRPVAAHWAASNHLPKTADTSEGFTRRWLMFSFDKQVELDKVDIRLAKKIIDHEREAIFSWAIEALPRLVEATGYTLSKSHKRVITRLACQTNPVLFFLMQDHALEFDETYECTEADLHHRFRTFLRIKVGSHRNIDMQDFRSMLNEGLHTYKLKITSKPNDLNTYYQGVRVAPLRMDD